MSYLIALLGKNLGIVLGLTFLESKYISSKTTTTLGTSSSNTSLFYYGITPLLLTVFHMWTVFYGFTVVGKARKKYADLAKADGEDNVDERYLLPNLYAQGTSKHVLAFNCIQRSHQHIFETMTQTVISSMIGWMNYPLSSGIITGLYVVGRISLSKGYGEADGDPMKRYSGKFAFFTWYGVISSIFLAGLSSVKMLTTNNQTSKSMIW